MADQGRSQVVARLFALMKLGSGALAFPRIKLSRKSETIQIPCLETVDQDRNTAACLTMLHPQARKFLTPSGPHAVVNVQLPEPLRQELGRATWQAAAPKWAVPKLELLLHTEADACFFRFKIADIKGLLFPTGILVLYVEVLPVFTLSDETAPTAGKMLLNILNRAGQFRGDTKCKNAPIERFFTDDRQRESVRQRMGDHNASALISGLCGETVSILDMLESLLPDEYRFLIGDRFLTNAFLKTGWDGRNNAFTPEDYADLVRLSRGESDLYLPDIRECRQGSCGIITTFENVAFALSGEGIACWIKPTEHQQFLQSQFKERYDNIYLQLYLLALHQRYALVDLAQRLDEATPQVEDIKKFKHLQDNGDIAHLDRSADELRDLRAEVADFYLRNFYKQPAVLSNHQQFYQVLQEALGVSDLLQEVQQATSELEYLIGSLQQEKTEAIQKQKSLEQNDQHNSLLSEISTLIREQEKSSRNELTLTLVVEAMAIPYYSFSFLAHALHVPDALAASISITITILTMGYTIFKLRG